MKEEHPGILEGEPRNGKCTQKNAQLSPLWRVWQNKESYSEADRRHGY
jgi:hypothetical protein